MEHAKNVNVVLADFDWSDLGTWSSLYDHLDKDMRGNAVNNENAFLIDCQNCIIKLPNEKVAIIQGLKNYIIAESDNRLLILQKEDEQNLKKYLDTLKNQIN
jgi:mannose-1-phosphate guanylyltransferase